MHAAPFKFTHISYSSPVCVQATTTLPYKLGATHLYPIIAPIANPQLDKFSKSHVINDTLVRRAHDTVIDLSLRKV